MKTKLAFLLSVNLFFTTLAFAEVNYNFNGRWEGKGKILEDSSLDSVDAKISLSITLNETSLNITECWTVSDSVMQQKADCYQNMFSVTESGKILSEGKEIGDVYPRYILIFRGNSQVSEQMKFGIDGSGALAFHYTYANSDGGASVHSGKLERQ